MNNNLWRDAQQHYRSGMASEIIPFQGHIEREKKLIGMCIIGDNEALHGIVRDLMPEDFIAWLPAKIIFRAIVEMARAGKEVNAVTLSAKLEKMNKLDECGGHHGLVILAEKIPSAATWQSLVTLQIQDSQKDQWRKAGYDAMTMAHDLTVSPEEIGDFISNQLININQRQYGNVYKTMTQGGQLMFDHIDKVRNGNSEIVNMGRLPSVFPSVSSALGGGYLEGLTLLAGAGGVGKTTLLLNEAAFWVERGLNVVFHSLEMKLIRLAYSYYSALSRIAVLDIENVQVADVELERLAKILSDKSQCPFYIDDEHGLTIDQIILRAKTMRSMDKCNVLLVDSLKAIKWSRRHYGMSKKDVWEDMIDDLRNFGTNNGVYVILIHHFNRSYQKRADRWPNWGDMDHISQDKPDCIAFLFSIAKAYQWDEYQNVIEYLVPEKNRGGAAGVRKLLDFQPAYGYYRELMAPDSVEYLQTVDKFRQSKQEKQREFF